MSEHSKIGASSAERWFNCPGSVKLSDGLVKVESEFAALGTAAHHLASYCLETGFNAKRFQGTHVVNPEGRIVDFCDDVGTPIDANMTAAVQVYLDAVREIATQSINRELEIEVRFHLDNLHPDLWGTADSVIYDPDSGELWVFDYKHGEGVPVYPENNPQLLYYAVGAAFAKSNRRVSEVHLAIVQPRTGQGKPQWWDVDAIDLLDFAEILREKAAATEDEKAELRPGEYCRWCPAAGSCPALKQVAEIAPLDQFTDGKPYDPEALADSLGRIKALNGWIKAVESFAESELKRGQKIPGWKLVEKVGRRAWKDEAEAVRALLGDGLSEIDIMVPAALRSPAQIEEIVGKKEFAALLGDYVHAPSTGLTIAPESDRRPAVNRDLKEGFEPV